MITQSMNRIIPYKRNTDVGSYLLSLFELLRRYLFRRLCSLKIEIKQSKPLQQREFSTFQYISLLSIFNYNIRLQIPSNILLHSQTLRRKQ